jgi:hypothetical protein
VWSAGSLWLDSHSSHKRPSDTCSAAVEHRPGPLLHPHHLRLQW